MGRGREVSTEQDPAVEVSERWRRHSFRALLIPGLFLGLFVLLLVWGLFGGPVSGSWYSVVNWTRDERNSSAVQALTAVAQAVFTVALVVLTLWQARAALVTAREQRAYTISNSQPVISFWRAELIGEDIEKVKVELVNNGLGVAFDVLPLVQVGGIPYEIVERGASRTLRPGESWQVTLDAGESSLIYFGLVNQGRDAGQSKLLCVLDAIYRDAYGRSLVSSGTLVSPYGRLVHFINPNDAREFPSVRREEWIERARSGRLFGH
jgi:hypothetical protein